MLPSFVFVITFLATFIIIVALIPSGLWMGSEAKEYRQTSVPEEFEALDLVQLAWHDNNTLLPSHTWYNPCYFWLPPTDPQIEIQVAWQGDPKYLTFWHGWVTWYGLPAGHYLGKIDDQTDMKFRWDYVFWEHFDPNTNVSSFEATCPHGTIYYIHLSYNQTAYASFEEAWESGTLYCLIGLGVEDAVAKINAWNIVGQLLTFQLPDVHPVLNLLIAIPIYACIAYLAYRLILLAIPFVGGS